jgi:hypothetical protein
MSAGQWFTLVRFRGDPQHLTGVSQPRTAREALDLLTSWEQAYRDDTTVVFDPDQRPLERSTLEYLASGLQPPRDARGRGVG